MNKIMILALAAATLATYLVSKRRRRPIPATEPVMKLIGNTEKHMTNVFSKAKKHNL